MFGNVWHFDELEQLGNFGRSHITWDQIPQSESEICDAFLLIWMTSSNLFAKRFPRHSSDSVICKAVNEMRKSWTLRRMWPSSVSEFNRLMSDAWLNILYRKIHTEVSFPVDTFRVSQNYDASWNIEKVKTARGKSCFRIRENKLEVWQLMIPLLMSTRGGMRKKKTFNGLNLNLVSENKERVMNTENVNVLWRRK